VPEQLALDRLRFGSELVAPIAKRLRRYAMRRAILALIQIAALPGFMIG
jgi:hypothetical protein